MLKIDIVTLFPEMFTGPFSESIIKRAQEKKLVKIQIHDLRKWSVDKHNTVDDKPYGGGPGMVLMIEPIDKALREIKSRDSKVILLSPQGKNFNQVEAKKLAVSKNIVLIAGHYEGFDQRIRENLVDEEYSIGDYVLTGGELPAMVIVDSTVRLIPGVLGDIQSLEDETHSKFEIDAKTIKTNTKYPVYTRPEEYKGWKVPEILLSGDHKKIAKWRESNSKGKSKKL